MPKKNIILVFLLLVGGLTVMSAQGGFKKKYYLPNSYSSTCRDVISAPSGDIIMIGVTNYTSSSSNFSRLTIIGTNPQGNVLWQKDYGGLNFRYLDNIRQIRGAVVKDASAFYHATAAKDIVVNSDISLLLKINYNGDTLWQKKFYSGQSGVTMYFQDVIRTADGGLLITGIFEGGGNRSIALLKMDLNGNELWRKKLVSSNTANPAWSGIKAIQDSATKKIIIVGYQYIGTNTQSLIMGTDSLGDKLWQTTFNNTQGGGFGEVIQTRDKNFITCGAVATNSFYSGIPLFKSLAVKFDINGDSIWRRTYDFPSIYTSFALTSELNNGDLMFSGLEDTTGGPSAQAVINTKLLRIDKNGNLKWAKYLSNANTFASSEYLRSMNPSQDGGFLIVGWLPNAQAPRPFRLIKIDSTGCDTTEAYCKSKEANIPTFTKVTGFSLSVFPNPAENIVYINVDAPGARIFALKVTDGLGRTIAEKKLEPGKDNEIDTGPWAGGVYFMNLFYENKTLEVKRLVVVK